MRSGVLSAGGVSHREPRLSSWRRCKRSSKAAINPAATAPAPISIPPPPDAQQQTPPSSQPSLRTSSDLVRIDVEVTGRDGKPLKGLQARAIHRHRRRQGSENRRSSLTKTSKRSKPRPMPTRRRLCSRWTRRATPPRKRKANRSRDRRLLVLFFDLTSLGRRRSDPRARRRREIREAADDQGGPGFGGALSARNSARACRISPTITHKLEKAIAQLTARGCLADFQSALRRGAKWRIRRAAGYRRRLHAPTKPNSTSSIPTRSSRPSKGSQCPRRDSRPQSRDRIHRRHHADRRRKSHAACAPPPTPPIAPMFPSIPSIRAACLPTVPGGDATTDAATGTSMFTGASVFHQTDQREDSRDTLATLSTDTGGKAFFDLGDLSDALPENPAGQ